MEILPKNMSIELTEKFWTAVGSMDTYDFQFPQASVAYFTFFVMLIAVWGYGYSQLKDGQQVVSVDCPLLMHDLKAATREQIYTYDCVSVLQRGWSEFKAGLDMYRMTTADGSETLVLNPKYLPELRNLPDKYLDFTRAIERLLAGKWAHIADMIMPWVVSVIKADLTHGLPRLMGAISEEIDMALERVMPSCDDWTPICFYDKAQDVVSQVSARVFVGKPLCRDARWLNMCKEYTGYAFGASRAIKKWRPWQRPFVFLFLEEMRGLLRHRRMAIKFMTPIVRERRTNDTDRDDFAEWMKKRSPPHISRNLPLQAEIQCQLAVAAIHTTSMSLTHVLYDLLEHPEYIPILRAECEEVLARNGGQYGRSTMDQLHKVDSFVKESQRFNPAGFTTFKRMVMEDLTLSDGKFLPKGTVLEVDGWLQYHDETLYPNADKFDGSRFERLRQKDHGSHMFYTSNADYVQWGMGKHACPGRFFASNEIKSILSKILLKYDIAHMDPTKGRPKNFNFGSQIQPCPKAEILIRERK